MKSIFALIKNEWRRQQTAVLILALTTTALWLMLYLLPELKLMEPYIAKTAAALTIGLPMLYCFTLADSFAQEFDRKTIPFLLGLPVPSARIYWVKYGVNLFLFILLSLLAVMLFARLFDFTDLTFYHESTPEQRPWFFVTAILLMLLLHAAVFFCALAGRNAANSIIALFVVPLLYLLTIPMIALVLALVPTCDWFAFAAYLLTDGLLLYCAFVGMGYYLWTQRLSSGLTVIKPLVIAAGLTVILSLIVYLVTYLVTAYEFENAVRAAGEAGLATDHRQLLTPFAPGDQDIVPELQKFNQDYEQVSKKHQTEMDWFSRFINGTDSWSSNYRKRSDHQPSDDEIKKAVAFILSNPEMVRLNAMQKKMIDQPKVRMNLDFSDFSQIYEVWRKGSVYTSMSFLTRRAFACRQEGLIPPMVDCWHTALKLIAVREKEQLMMHSFLKLRIINSIIISAAFTPETAAFYRELIKTIENSIWRRWNQDVSHFTEFRRDYPEYLTKTCLKRNHEPFSHDEKDLKKPLPFWQRLLLLTAQPRADRIMAKLIREGMELHQLQTKAEKVPLFKDIKTEHDRLIHKIFPVTAYPYANVRRSTVTTYYQYQTNRNGYRLALALLVYRCDHGVFPATLGELVPALLPSIPVGSFTGKPFDYRRVDNGFDLTNDDSADGAGDTNTGFKLHYRPWPGMLQEDKR